MHSSCAIRAVTVFASSSITKILQIDELCTFAGTEYTSVLWRLILEYDDSY